jgi:hypothetical protein
MNQDLLFLQIYYGYKFNSSQNNKKKTLQNKVSIINLKKTQENSLKFCTRFIVNLLHELTEPRTETLFLSDDCCCLF